MVHLATALKSNRDTVALDRAQADVADRPAGAVPAHLRDAHYRGASALGQGQGQGQGQGYDYPHDDERGWVAQEHRPAELADRVYYGPSAHGHEEEIARRMATRESHERDGHEDRKPT